MQSFATPVLYTSATVVCSHCGDRQKVTFYHLGEPCPKCGKLSIELPHPNGNTHFDVRYTRQPTFNEDDMPKTSEEIDAEYTKVADVWAANLGEVYHFMQGEVWSPHGERNDLISRLSLKHTSMSVGDLVFDAAQKKWFIVVGVGFNEFTPDPYPKPAEKRPTNAQCPLITANGRVFCVEYHCYHREIGAACPPYMRYAEAVKKSDLLVQPRG